MERFDKLLDNLKKEDFNDSELKDFKKFEKIQREKTDGEVELINYINLITNELRNKYGLENRDILPEQIFMVKEQDWPQEDNDADAITFPHSGLISIKDTKYIIPNFAKLLHEIMHYKSYSAYQVIKKEDEKFLAVYRNGLIVRARNGEERYFCYLEEGITQDLTKNALDEALLNNEILKEEYQKFQNDIESRKNKARDNYIASMDAFGSPMPLNDNTFFINEDGRFWETFSYGESMRLLDVLSNKLFEKNQDKFQSESEVKEIFRKSRFTGDLLELGRLIDKTFGKGTFRKIGEINDDKQARKFIKNLNE
jgi:hypothetical protein